MWYKSGDKIPFLHQTSDYLLLICAFRFAAALKDLKVWVMNVVSIDSPDTLPIIFERGLFGMYHDWCESFNTYPRTYDLLHADHLFSVLKKRFVVLHISLFFYLSNYILYILIQTGYDFLGIGAIWWQ